jgi:selenide,water dikinase
VGAEVTAAAVPVLPGARAMVAQGTVPGGTKRNLESLQDSVSFATTVSDVDRTLLADAQTSGGLLLAVAFDRVDRLRQALERESTPAAAVIGRVTAGPAGSIQVR